LEIKTIAVLGAGLMVVALRKCCQGGKYEVYLRDIKQRLWKRNFGVDLTTDLQEAVLKPT